MSNPVWAGVTIDPELLKDFGWYVGTVVVDGVTYSRLIGYQVAGLSQMDTLLNTASGTAAAAGGAVASIRYEFDGGTAAGDPGTGKIRLNNSTLASATTIYLSNTNYMLNDVAALVDTFDDSTSTVKGMLGISHQTDPSKWAVYSVTGAVTNGSGYKSLSIAYVAGPGGFTSSDQIVVGFARKGDKGDIGLTGPMPTISANSATSLAVGTGTKVFTTDAAMSAVPGAMIMAASQADPTNYMFGQVTAIAGTSVTLNVLAVGGSGTFADWKLQVAGARGATGATGPLPVVKTTSATAVSIGSGSKTFATAATVDLGVGGFVLISSQAAPTTNWMLGQITAVAANSVTVNVSLSSGTGSFSDWSLCLSSAPGAAASGGEVWAGTAGGTADAITLTPSTALTSPVDGVTYGFVASATNTTTSPTLNVSGLGALPIKKLDGTAPAVGDILAGTKYTAVYIGGNWRISLSAAGSAVQTSTVFNLAGGNSYTVTAGVVLAVYEQFVGSTFNVDFNTRANYQEQDSSALTALVGGQFQMANTAGAVIDGETKLLIHSDGVNGSTEILDERGITPFGTHCGWFDGASSWKVPQSYKVAFGTGDFTYEFWGRFNSLTGNIIDTRPSTSTSNYLVFGFNGSGQLSATMGDGNTSPTTAALSTDTFYHVALVRKAGVLTIYLSGVSAASAANTTSMSAGPIVIGASWDLSTPINGWLDQFRVSKVARYTANFTPSTTAFVPDADTVHLFTFDDGHGGQVLKDRANSGRPVRVKANISSAQAKFGTTSANCAPASGGGVSIGESDKAHADLNFGSDNFTVDMQVFPLSHSGATSSIFSYSTMGTPDLPSLGVRGTTTANQYKLTYCTDGSNVLDGPTFTVPLNVWSHLAVVRSGATLYVFLNGASVGTVNVGTASLFYGSTPFWRFGEYYNAGYLDGYIDEVRLQRGEAVWTSAFTPPTAPHVANDRTILLLHFEGANGDKVTLDSSGSSYGTNAFGDTTTPALTFQGGSALATTQTRGGHPTSLALNGTSQYASQTFAAPSAGHPIFFGANAKLCLEGWFYFNSLGYDHGLFAIVDSANTSLLRLYAAQTSGNLTVIIGGSSFSAGVISAGWHHIALIREGRGWTTAVDGVLGTFYIPQVNVASSSNAQTLYVGAYNNGGTIINNLAGAVDAIRITNGSPRYTANFTPATLVADDTTTLLWVFDGSVGQTWVKELSQNTALIAANGNARTVKDGAYITPALVSGSNNVTISTANSKFGTGSLLGYAGTGGSKYSVTHQPWMTPGSGSSRITVEAWVNINASQTNIIAQKTNGTDETWQIWGNNDTNTINLRVKNSGGTQQTISTSTALTPGTTYHIAVSFAPDGSGASGSDVYFFVNGTLVSTGNLSLLMRTDTSGPLYLVTDMSGTGFYGWVDELRISSTGRWSSSFTPPTMAYGQQYATGPAWIATKPGLSALDLSAFTTIGNATLTGTTPPNTSMTFLISTDGYATPLKRWNGSAWVATAYSMSWNSGTSTVSTTATSAQLQAVGNSMLELQAGLVALDASTLSSLNVVAVLSTTNQQFTPTLDNLAITMAEFQQMQPVVDYMLKFKKNSNGTQTNTITRVKAGTANMFAKYS